MSRRNSDLNDLVDRIERIESERKDLLDDKNQILKEAAGKGYDAKIIRAVLQRRKKERQEVLETDQLIETYESELGMEILS